MSGAPASGGAASGAASAPAPPPVPAPPVPVASPPAPAPPRPPAPAACPPPDEQAPAPSAVASASRDIADRETGRSNVRLEAITRVTSSPSAQAFHRSRRARKVGARRGGYGSSRFGGAPAPSRA